MNFSVGQNGPENEQHINGMGLYSLHVSGQQDHTAAWQIISIGGPEGAHEVLHC